MCSRKQDRGPGKEGEEGDNIYLLSPSCKNTLTHSPIVYTPTHERGMRQTIDELPLPRRGTTIHNMMASKVVECVTNTREEEEEEDGNEIIDSRSRSSNT